MFDRYQLDRLASMSVPNSVELNPSRFYALAELAKEIDEETKDALRIFVDKLDISLRKVDEDVEELAKANDHFLAEVRRTTRRRNPFELTANDEEDFMSELQRAAGNTFLGVIFGVFRNIQMGYHQIREIAEGVQPATILIVGDRINGMPKSVEELQMLTYQIQLNQGAIDRFTNGIINAEASPTMVVSLGRHVTRILEQYYNTLLRRHSTEGIEIHGDPVVTDLAMSIFENVDAHGEIQDGKKPDEVSAFSVRKATIIADAIRSGSLGRIIEDPENLIAFIKQNLEMLWSLADALHQIAKPIAKEIRRTINLDWAYKPPLTEQDFSQALTFIEDLDPNSVPFKEKTGLLSAEERKELGFRNETLAHLVGLLQKKGTKTQDIIQYILGRKHELRKYHLEENSFFVCKIGSGNPFGGEAPGALEVVSGIKPTVVLNEVRGSGFEEVKDFIKNVHAGAKWHNLFVATSPSKKADKSNILLVGPMGCHRKGQKVLMYDGTLLPVDQVRIGDQLMGPDSTPRRVLELHRGTEEMVEIIPTKGDPWVVNKGHILTLVRTSKKIGAYPGRPAKYWAISEEKDVILSDYLTWSKTQKNLHKLFRTGVDFEPAEALPLDPYFVGTLLGDGCLMDRLCVTNEDTEVVQEAYRQADKFGLHVSVEGGVTRTPSYHLSGTSGKTNPITAILRELGLAEHDAASKFIPHSYKTASRKDRLELLAGLVDTDGRLHGGCYDYVSKSKALVDDIAFVARSLGLAAYVSPSRKKSQNGTWGNYFRVILSGHTNRIPVRLEHKKSWERRQVKNVLRTSFKTRELPPEEYFGFTLDGDHRYLLDDFTVTHNCGKTEVLRAVASDRSSIGIFAQASDFLTCWKGEAEKNPKRLFEAGLKIQKESKKQVFFLIDEIDTILNGDRGHSAFGGTNLVSEFQILMDGITTYPNLAVWGATNHPERIPMPIIRRFAKVIIVGELTQQDRVELLQQFAAYMPLAEDFPDEAWQDAATKLEGSVGDHLRKIVDNLWRQKMGWFVTNHVKEAEEVSSFLDTLKKGQKFDIATFTSKDREKLHTMLRPFVLVRPKDVHDSIDQYLSNVAFRTEIQTAQTTYTRARDFLAGLNAPRE